MLAASATHHERKRYHSSTASHHNHPTAIKRQDYLDPEESESDFATGGGFWLSIFALRTHLIEFVLREEDFRHEMMSTIAPEYWIAPALATSGDALEPMQSGSIKALGIQKPWAPARSYGLVARLDSRGETTESLHSRVDGRIHGVTTVRPIGRRVLAVSKGRNCLVESPPACGVAEG